VRLALTDDKEAGVTLTFLKSERVIAFLKSERAVDGLRWIAAFIAVVSTYGVAAWMVLRPTGWQFDANAPAVEINLRDLPQPSPSASSDRASEPAAPSNPTSDNAQSELAQSADTVPPAASGSGNRAGDGGRDSDAVDVKDGSSDAAKTAALEAEKAAITQPGAAADATAETPLGTEAPAVGSGGSRPTASPPHTPDTPTARSPIDTSITVNQGRSLLRSTKGGPQSKSLPLPQLKLTLPLPTLKEPFSKRPNPLVGLALPAPGLMLPAPGPTAPSANQGHIQDLAQKPAIGTAGGVMRNAIGIAIEQRAAVTHAGAPLLGVHPLPSATSTAMHASSEHGPTTNAVGAPLVADTASPRDPRLSTGAPNQSQAGHADRGLQAGHVATIGGPAVNGAAMNRPASSTGAVGSPGHVVAGVLNGSSFRTKYR
jgi:hypothetical protein